MTDTLTVGDLELEVRWSDRRRSLQLTIDRGGELIVSAPTGTPRARLERFVRDKRFWVYTKLAQKAALRKASRPRELVAGESFPYLGRTHRLELVHHQDCPLKLAHGRFRLRRSDRQQGRAHFIAWYTDHARRWIEPRVSDYAQRLRVRPSGIEIRDLGHRWGSCGKRAVLNFHWGTILLPPRIIEYVIAHELTHLHEPHHTPTFWHHLERTMPDYADRKTWLAEHGAGYSVQLDGIQSGNCDVE